LGKSSQGLRFPEEDSFRDVQMLTRLQRRGFSDAKLERSKKVSFLGVKLLVYVGIGGFSDPKLGERVDQRLGCLERDTFCGVKLLVCVGIDEFRIQNWASDLVSG
jgi:hypothetical protein